MNTTGNTSSKKKTRPFSRYEWMIAFRYMIPNRKQLFTSVVSIISLIGIFLGVYVLIVVMAVMNGFRADLVDRLVGINGHVVVSAIDGSLDDFADVIPRLEKVDGIKYAVPFLQGEAFVQGDVGSGTGVYIRGLREIDLKKMSMIASHIEEGTLNAFDQSEGIAIGIGMAEKFSVSVGDSLRIITPDGDVTPFGVTPRVKSYTVVAIFDVGTSLYNSNLIFMPLKEAALFFNKEGAINSLEVFIDNPDAADQMIPFIKETLGRDVVAKDWRFLNRDLFNALQIERIVMFIILSLIILVASLNIISGLVMLVKDKGHDIAILRTMGASQGAILRIFILAGFIIGIIGTVFGTIFALLTCWNIESVKEFISWIFNVNVFNPQTYPLAKLPARLDVFETVSVIAMALVLSFLASFLPAWRAARLDPVQALRYE